VTDWHEAINSVPRGLFIPQVVWADLGPGPWVRVDRASDPAKWDDVVARDIPLVTQFEDGAAEGEGLVTSSASMPGVVVQFLAQLDPQDDDRVLEIGTGTGWTTALLSWRVGAERVTSVEIDPYIALMAAENLKAAGCRPRLVVGDGEAGWSEEAPYDRVHVTCAVSRLPYAWVEQTRPGGVIVAPYAPGFGYGTILRLEVLPDGTARGRFAGSADYMMMRSQRPAKGPARRWAQASSGEVAVSRTAVDPRDIRHAPIGADLAIAVQVPGVVSRFYTDDSGATLWVLDRDDHGGPWASVEYEPDQKDFEVQQHGKRKLWDEVAAAYAQWLGWGRPEISRFGMTLTPETCRVWLDDHGNEIEPQRAD
jgi:protein-L-isoaspartate O-methyltransferase